MEKPVIKFHPEAAEDVVGARKWYESRSPAAAIAFAAELERALETLLEAPDRWPKDQRGLRRYLLHRFPFSVVYRLHDEILEIVAVAHLHRRPGYWHAR